MHYKKLVVTISAVLLLQGCVAAAVLTIVGGTSVATDERSVGTQMNDQKIEFEAYAKLSGQKALGDNTNLQVISVNGSVLVIGQAPNTYLRDLAIKNGISTTIRYTIPNIKNNTTSIH